MNADRVRLSVAVFISIAVHGVIASLGGFSAGQVDRATHYGPVTVTIAAVTASEIKQPEPRLQESNAEVAEPAKTEVSVPANIVPEQKPPIQPPISDELSPAEAKDTPPPSKPMHDQARPVEVDAPISAQQSAETTLVDESAGSGNTEAVARMSLPETPDVTAIPLYHLIPKPNYPSRSRDLGEEGVVIIAVLVSKDGSVLQAYVLESSGYPLLDGSALATVTERWRFKPGMRRGEVVPSWVRVPIKFSIRGS